MSVSRNPNLGCIASQEAVGEQWRRNLGRSKIHLSLPRSSSEWWTGLDPSHCPGFSNGKLSSLEIPVLDNCTRSEVRDYFNNTWTLSELLFSSLIGEEPFYRPPYHGLRHPMIFYFGHPPVLYINKLRVAGLLDTGINAYYESLFETGVDEMSWDDMSKNDIEWPSIDDTIAYRREVYAKVLSVIDSHPDLEDGHSPITQKHPLWALFMGFEHERIHIETSSVLIRELPVHMVARPDEWMDLASIKEGDSTLPSINNHASNMMVKVPAATVTYGKPNEWPTFGWDNEYGQRTVSVEEFEAGKFLVSNSDYWQFVADGGYYNKDYWTEAGWSWRSFRNVKWPTFWVPDGPAGSNQYRLRTCFEVIDMQWNWPAVVNFHEAKAYCNWKSQKDKKNYRLQTEAEHQSLRSFCHFQNDKKKSLIVPEPANINLRHGSECSVDLDGSAGINDLFGNVWQWCEDHFNPLEGSQVHPYYDDFSMPCYDGRHQMIMGGSFISTGDEATSWARFHFRPHFFQHAGFRLVSSNSDGAVTLLGSEDRTPANPYETEDSFNEYMTLHYGSSNLQMPFENGPSDALSFPQRCADLVTKWCRELSIEAKIALDLGCAVGAASFRLSESFHKVVGLDFSARFIEAANDLKAGHLLKFKCREEADIYSVYTARVNPTSADRIEFIKGDACAIPGQFSDFDAVLMANLLCRLPDPRACLQQMWENRGVVRPGGLLVIVSPYTWMDKFTPRHLWLGGFINDSGKPQYSEDALKELLSPHFDLLEVLDMPLLIREHRRKYQYIISQAMVWRRK